MYCSSCGAVVAKGSGYCKHCGARLSWAKDDGGDKPAELFPDSLVWAIVSVFIIGFGCLIGLVAMMKELLHSSDVMIYTIMLVSFLTILLIESTFIWLLLQRRGRAKEVYEAERMNEHATKELDAAQARALPEPLQSITEHTTRTFEPVYNKRKSE